MASILGTLGKGIKEAITETGKNAGKAIGAAHENITLSAARKIKDVTKESSNALGKALNKSASETTSKIAFGRLSNESWFGKAADDIAFADVSKETLKNYAADLNLSKSGSKAQLIERINGANISGATQEINKAGEAVVEGAGEKIGKNIANKSSRKKNAIIGSVVGGISGAGIGGLAGIATGADEDNQNGMIVTGAIAGIAGGAIVGGLFGNNITKIAGNIAKNGGANEAVEGGAEGLIRKAKTSARSIGDKLDDIGTRVAKRASADDRLALAKTIKKAAPEGVTSKQALDIANKAAKSSPEELAKGIISMEGVNGKVNFSKEEIANITSSMKKANMFGGAAQGAIMGSVGGAVIGGIGGAADEDDTFIGGALKGGMLGGVLGGIGGGASGFFNNNARVLSNTTSNIKSLIGK